MKFYGSRFCRQCGKLFELTAAGQQRCASCEESGEPAPAAPPTRITLVAPVTPAAPPAAPPPAAVKVTVRAPAKPRHRQRGSQPRVTPPARTRTATGTAKGTLPMLRALAAAPKGLTTPELAELGAGAASSWVNALGITRQLMLKQQRQGRVGQAGYVDGDRTRPSVLWRITEEGRRYVREADDSQPGAVTMPPPPAKPEPDFDEPTWKLLSGTQAGKLAIGKLRSIGCRTLGDLLFVTSADLLAIWGFGPGCLEAVREALASRGLVLVDELGPEDFDEITESTG